MPSRTDLFYSNPLYKLLHDSSIYSYELLQEFNLLLHEQPDLVECSHPNEGSFFHIICRNSTRLQSVAFRMIYSLSNAGGDPNLTDGKGNTPLHEAIIRGLPDCGFDLVQALFRVGVDQRVMNYEGKTADAYLGDNPQLQALYKSYGDGIWAAVETSNVSETERLIKGFIKVDCKHNTNKTLLDKAHDINCTSIIHMLAEYQVTNEFLHSILACDWDRASLVYQHESKFLKIDSLDTVHRLTFIRTYSKSLLESCLDTYSPKPFEILYSSPTIRVNINVLCTDGLPFFFHCFDDIISDNIRNNMLLNCNMYMKSSKGETILFHLLRLYSEKPNNNYLKIFTNILYLHPLLLSQRNEHEQTVIELMEFSKSLVDYKKYRPFYESIMNMLRQQLKRNMIIEQFILNQFGYYLLIFFNNKTLQMTKHVYKLIRSLKLNRGLSVLIPSMFQAIIDDNLITFKTILKIKANIYQAKDSFGRTSAHLAVLYQRYDILTFICNNHPDLINAKDNLYRTSFHYACIMKDTTSIELLEKANAKQIIDCLNFCPNDYVLNRDLCSEEYSAEEFRKKEIERKSSFISNYLKLSFYPRFKSAIEVNSVDDIKYIHEELTQMGFHLKDFNPNSYLNDFVQGERYIPLLFLAMEHRAIASLQCLIELGIPLIGIMYMSKSKIKTESHWMSSRIRTDEIQSLDIIDIINDLKDDNELKHVFQQRPSTEENPVRVEEPETDSNVVENVSKRDTVIEQFFPNYNKKSQTCVVL